MKCLNIKIQLIYGIILAMVNFPTSQGSRICDLLEERLNISDTQKDKLNLNQCGGIIHDEIDALLVGRRSFRRYQITKVSFLLPSVKSHLCIPLLTMSFQMTYHSLLERLLREKK